MSHDLDLFNWLGDSRDSIEGASVAIDRRCGCVRARAAQHRRAAECPNRPTTPCMLSHKRHAAVLARIDLSRYIGLLSRHTEQGEALTRALDRTCGHRITSLRQYARFRAVLHTRSSRPLLATASRTYYNWHCVSLSLSLSTYWERTGGQQVTLVLQCPGSRVAARQLKHHCLSALHLAAKLFVRSTTAAVEDDDDSTRRLVFVAGGGASEIALARRLKHLALELEHEQPQRHHRMALVDLAACLEELVETLADNAGLTDAQRIVSDLVGGSSDSKGLVFSNALKEWLSDSDARVPICDNTAERGLVDVFDTKAATVLAAVEAACALLRGTQATGALALIRGCVRM